jgi:hypothetical protein
MNLESTRPRGRPRNRWYNEWKDTKALQGRGCESTTLTAATNYDNIVGSSCQ